MNNTNIYDIYTSDTNINKLHNASNNMIKDKYNITINKNNLNDIIMKIVKSISSDENLINSKTLNELNKLTLLKIRDFIGLNIKNSNTNLPSINNTVSKLDKQPNQSSPKFIQNQEILQNVPSEKNIIDDDDLMNKMKILEENRNNMNSLNTKIYDNNINYLHNDKENNKTNSIDDIKLLLIDLIASKTTDNTIIKENKEIIKKDLFINSINRDWSTNKDINNLKLNISIDIKNYYIEPHIILLPVYIKNNYPYIIVVFSDNTKSQSFNYIFNKNNGNWDEWININKNIETINILSKNWKIALYDNKNNELQFCKDDIDIIEVEKVSNNYKLKLLDTYKNHNLKSNDLILIKTNDSKYHNKKIINIDNETILINDTDIVIDNFINSKIAVIKDQFTINLKYYPRL